MKKIPIPIVIYSFGFAFLALAMPAAALAQAVITEIMYDPVGADSGHEWIEIYNASATAIPLTSWKLYGGDTGHKITAASGGASVAPHSFAVIAASAVKFQSDYPDFASGSGQLFHSAFSLNNSGMTIALYDASSSIIDSASYDSGSGALGDGNSLQRPPDDAAQFSPHVPTPGTAMLSGVIPAKAPKEKTSKVSSKKSSTKAAKSASQTSPQDSATGISDTYPQGTVEPVATSSQVADASLPAGGDSYWWLAATALAAVVAGATVASKHLKKSEWDIVEEKPEDV
jgi:hypothetical protein